jgi:hypothetical protein
MQSFSVESRFVSRKVYKFVSLLFWIETHIKTLLAFLCRLKWGMNEGIPDNNKANFVVVRTF